MGSAINCVFPGRAGDIARAYYLSEEKNIDFPGALSTVFVETSCSPSLDTYKVLSVSIILYLDKSTFLANE